MAIATVISEKRARAYTPGELMVVSAAREIRDGEVVFVGMRLPLIAFVVAKKTHAPNAIGLFENGGSHESAAIGTRAPGFSGSG